MSIFRRQTPRVKSWEPQPGNPLPEPVLEDDRDQIDPVVVKNVLMWLNQMKAEYQERFRATGGTPIRITMDRPIPSQEFVPNNRGRKLPAIKTPSRIRIQYNDGLNQCREGGTWGCATVEMILKDKRRAPVIASYHYLAARDEQNRCIVGPLLSVVRKRDIVLATSLPS